MEGTNKELIMDLFKEKGMQLADSLDWNCKNICKRNKGDTRIIHKKSRSKLKVDLRKEVESKDE